MRAGKTDKMPHPIRNTILVLLICGVAGLILTGVLFFGDPEPTKATVKLEFSFDGAADGIAPNGNAFDIRDITSDEVLEEALKASSLDGAYTPEQIRSSMVVRGIYPEDMAAQATSYESLLNFTASREQTVDEYHPTTFTVALHQDFDPSVSEANLRALLDNIVTAYKAYFRENYSYHMPDSVFLSTDITNYDYVQQLDILESELNMLSGYADEVYDREPAFLYNGIGFNDISVRFQNLILTDISKLNADITMNGLTRDTGRLLIQYRYEVRRLSNSLEKEKEQLANLDALIEAYDKNEIIYLSTSESLEKIDGNSSETYDALVERRKSVADDITQTNSEISSYMLQIADLTGEALISEAPVAEKAADAVAESTEAEEEQEEEGTEAEEAAEESAQAVDESAEAAEESTEAADEGVEESSEAVAGDAADADENDGADAEGEAADLTNTEVIEEQVQEVTALTDEDIAAAAEEAENAMRRKRERLENNINALIERIQGISEQFGEMLEAYNAQEINDLTVTAFDYKYTAPRILSGAFIKKAIKVCGPICAVAFMICALLVIISEKKREKEA